MKYENSELNYLDRPEVRQRLKKPIIAYAITVLFALGAAAAIGFAFDWLVAAVVASLGIAIAQVINFPRIKDALGDWEVQVEADKQDGRKPLPQP